MKLTMLGTGNAMVVDYYNTCFALSDQNRHFLVDAGGGNRILKILRDLSIPLSEIHDIFITHEHPDHLLGVIWLIRGIGTQMNKNKYEGELRIYCHEQLADAIRIISGLTLQKKVCAHFEDRIRLIPIHHGETKKILDCNIQFFDIMSTKATQYGFTLTTPAGTRLTCAGDEPYHEADYEFVKGSDWLMHEAFCLYSEADKFAPYEKHHSTVREACELAEQLNIPNLLLYHTEETHLTDRQALYTAEGREYYHGNLYVPEDLESFEIE